MFYIQKQVGPGLRPPPHPWLADVQYSLVRQWPAASEADSDALIAMEDALEGARPAAQGDRRSTDKWSHSILASFPLA
ncbi:hypothetical protein NicSoilB8_19980 [Arthrobacter sp. NicSoilB8]|nr:hypothetical protein NicSoilB8_19980 [Arthrobacter sp. NicSoilB8]